MNKRTIVSIAAFLIMALFCLITAWLTGFDFDHRGRGVAFMFGISTFFSLFAAAATYTCPVWWE